MPRVALVEVEGDDLGIPVDPQGQLRQIVGADREAVKQLRKGVDRDDVVRDLAHDEDLEPIIAPLQAVLGHRSDHLFAFRDSAAERYAAPAIATPSSASITNLSSKLPINPTMATSARISSLQENAVTALDLAQIMYI